MIAESKTDKFHEKFNACRVNADECRVLLIVFDILHIAYTIFSCFYSLILLTKDKVSFYKISYLSVLFDTTTHHHQEYL